MRSVARRLAMLALVPAALFGAVVMASPAEAAAPTAARMVTDIVNATNRYRAQAGCAKVRMDANLGKAARGHSAWMAQTRKFSHVGSGNSTFATRVKRTGYTAPLSENIAYGYRSGAQVAASWMKSPGHRANMLNCRAKAVGVGAAYASNGTTYFTQVFGTR